MNSVETESHVNLYTAPLVLYYVGYHNVYVQTSYRSAFITYSADYSETVGAFGTIAKYIAGINDTDVEYEDYIDYAEVHHTHYVPQFQTSYGDYQYYDYPAAPSPQFVNTPREDGYDYPYVNTQQQDSYDYPYLTDTFYPSQTEQISNNLQYEDYSNYYETEGRTIEEQVERSGYADPEKQTVEEALYIIGKWMV